MTNNQLKAAYQAGEISFSEMHAQWNGDNCIICSAEMDEMVLYCSVGCAEDGDTVPEYVEPFGVQVYCSDRCVEYGAAQASE